ncbi:MAG: ATP-binding protein, partial [Longimicrobiales bacterium]|nr:ATP-binding protein [Longimicrobiales bacterium]
MDHARPAPQKTRSSATEARVEGILARWMDTLADPSLEGDLPEELLESYQSLARMILDRSLNAETGAPPFPDPDLDGLLAAIVMVNRRTRQSLAATISRFSRLTHAVVSHVAETEEISDKAEATLRAAMDVDTVLDETLHRLVRVQEEGAIREEEERARAMQAVMEVLSHELDNRLGAAQTAVDIIANPRVELSRADLDRVSTLVRNSLEDALKTVDDVEALVGTWGAGSPGGEKRRGIRLPVLLRKIVEELAIEASEAGVRLELAPDQVDRSVDAPRLRLILYNLVSNGIRYRDPAKDQRWVIIESDVTPDDRLRIRVRDNGIGIA